MPHGVLVLDKEPGLSSAQALRAIKQEYGRKTKVGHAGTLDPFATGVLLALIGDATRLSSLAMALPKEYVARVRFGWQTDTLDPSGVVVAECDPGPAPTLPLDSFRGEISQLPPVYSALKVDGRRAYALARRGEAPELAPRNVVVYEIESDGGWPETDLRIRCGAGTYIRALARDLGEAVGLPASLVALRRTAIGPFRADARGVLFTPEALVEAADVSTIELDRESAVRFVTGQGVDCDGTGRHAALLDGRLLGLGDASKGRLYPSSVLAQARLDLEQGRV